MKKRSNFAVMARLIGLVKPLAGFMLLAIFMGIVGNLCASFITVFGAYAVTEVLGFSVPLTLAVIFILMLVMSLLRGVLRYAEQASNHFIAFKLLALIRDRVFQALRKLSPAKLEGRDRGDLIALITSDIELLEVFYAHTISPIAIAIVFSLVMCLFIGAYHPLLGILAAVAYICVGVMVPLVTAKLSGDTAQQFRKGSCSLSSFVLDGLRGLNETIQYGAGKQRLKEMNQQSDALSSLEKKMSRTTGRNAAITNTVILLFDAGMLCLSAWLFTQQAVGFDGVLLPTIALMSSFGPVTALASLGSTLQSTLAAGNRVLDILDEQPVTADVSGKPAVSFSGAAAENVTFAYGEEPILRDFSVEIPKGKVIGINGKSGSGKSTFLKLLMRFWQADSGSITISGADVNEINTNNLREMESFVTQETHLFHDSIAANLRIAKPDATQQELEAACKKASVHEFIMTLPKGYETEVGELGDTLSGGERQRIGLARAFLHDADFMLLDEPTSNLDSLNEAVILKSLHTEHGGKTVVLVSHRKSTMRIADKVYSVENGRVS